MPTAELQASSEVQIRAVTRAAADSRPVLLRMARPIASVLPERAVEKSDAAGNARKARFLWISPLLVFLFATGATFSAIYIDALRTASGLTVPRFVRAILPDPSLGLRVDYQGEHLLVAWNLQSPTVRAAVAGVLQIEDGGERRIVHLDAAQVSAGSVLYKPASDDVTFRLELYSDQGNTSIESMRVLAPRDAPSAPATVKPESEPPHVSDNSAVPRESVQSKRHSREISETSVTEASAPDTGAVKPEKRNTQPPAESAKPVNTPQYVPPVSTPPSATMTKSPSGPTPDLMPDGKTLSLFKPARALRQVMPNTASFRPALIYKPLRVTVLVTIDHTGHVTKAELSPGETMLSSGLPGAALAAARVWLFEPATLHGVPIESQHSIVFEFQPAPTR